MVFSIEITYPVSNDSRKLAAFSDVRWMIPGCRADVNKTMAETFMNNLTVEQDDSWLSCRRQRNMAETFMNNLTVEQHM